MHDAPGLVAKPRASDPPPPHSPYRRPVMERTGGSEAERASLRATAQVEKGVITAKSSQSGARMKIATAPWPQFDQSHPPPKNRREEEDKYGNGPVTDSPSSARPFGNHGANGKRNGAKKRRYMTPPNTSSGVIGVLPSHVNLKLLHKARCVV